MLFRSAIWSVSLVLLVITGLQVINGDVTVEQEPVANYTMEATTKPSSNATLASLDPLMVENAANTMFEEYWEMNLELSPQLATSVGDHRFNDKLNSYSLKSYEKRKVILNEYLERANQLLPLSNEGSYANNNLLVFISSLQYELDELMIGSHLFPISFMDSPQTSLQFLLKYTPLNTTQDYENLLSRYMAFPQQVEDIIEVMKEGIRTNMTVHERSLKNLEQKWHLVPVNESSFYQPFLNISDAIVPEAIEELQTNATRIVSDVLFPAFRRLADFIKNEYENHLRPEIGLSSLPNGNEFYRQRMNFHLTANETIDEIHALGLSEVERISRDMEDVIRSLGLNLTRAEFADELRNDPSNFFVSSDEALESYRNAVYNEIEPRLPMLFKNIPQAKLYIEKAPENIGSGPRAFYLHGSPDGSTPATFYLDTSSLKNLPKYEVFTLAMHEGLPGHHLQISYTLQQIGMPKFRQQLGYNAFIEGWALYSEYLGYEMGLYEDPYMLYGHLSEEIFRACRMVVDTGMHALGWSRQQAINYMMAKSASSLGNIEVEVDRYITWPGQACSYKYGEIKIKELRRKAEVALGDEFNIKEFHDLILKSNGPMSFVEKQVDYFIANAKKSMVS